MLARPRRRQRHEEVTTMAALTRRSRSGDHDGLRRHEGHDEAMVTRGAGVPVRYTPATNRCAACEGSAGNARRGCRWRLAFAADNATEGYRDGCADTKVTKR